MFNVARLIVSDNAMKLGRSMIKGLQNGVAKPLQNLHGKISQAYIRQVEQAANNYVKANRELPTYFTRKFNFNTAKDGVLTLDSFSRANVKGSVYNGMEVTIAGILGLGIAVATVKGIQSLDEKKEAQKNDQTSEESNISEVK